MILCMELYTTSGLKWWAKMSNVDILLNGVWNCALMCSLFFHKSTAFFFDIFCVNCVKLQKCNSTFVSIVSACKYNSSLCDCGASFILCTSAWLDMDVQIDHLIKLSSYQALNQETNPQLNN